MTFVAKSDDCWEWTGGRTGAGYGAFTVGDTFRLAHRWQWAHHNGPIPKGMYVLHHCDNPACVRPDHLWLGSPLANMRDKVAKGRHVAGRLLGTAHPRAKLTDDDVRAIRVAYANGGSYRTLGAQYGMGRTTIRNIVKRTLWRHID